jgi:hypothetical protein
VLAGKHVVAELLDAGFARERVERGEDLVVDEVLRVVEENRGIGGGGREGERELVKARAVGGKQVLEDERGCLGLVQLLQLGPGRVFCRSAGAGWWMDVSGGIEAEER